MVLLWLALALGSVTLSTLAAPTASGPTVQLDDGTFVGKSVVNIDKFYGIPFAQPPVGDLRLRRPQPLGPYSGTTDATAYGPACPQQAIKLNLPLDIPSDTLDAVINSVYGTVFPDAEDCLTLNVVRPSSVQAGDNLPVVVWFFGGGFELGSPTLYDGGLVVERSIAIGQPVIYVSMNYRLAAFGFLGSKEVRDEGVGNLGLHDQREALRWVQKYIGAFGGDPTKVTAWGESAGAISIALQMITNGGNLEGLFRGAFMQSGSPIPVGPIETGQPYFDTIAEMTGCSSAKDKLQCLRGVPYAQFKQAMNKTPFLLSYQSLNLAYLPRVDGVFLTDNPQQLVLKGSVARLPLVTGDCDDEGTLFSLGSLNVTSDQDFSTYLSDNYLHGTSPAEAEKLASLYPSDPISGSPFDTGILNILTPQFKRLAAVQGDLVFQAPRRFFLSQIASQQDAWTYIYKKGKALPILGTFHTSDLLNSFLGGELGEFAIRFTSTLDPNGGKLLPFPWPKWTSDSRSMLAIRDGLFTFKLVTDDYRQEQMDYITQLSLVHPL